MARFATVSKNELEKLLADKDAENTEKATKLAVNIFTTYLKEKKIKEPDDKESLAAVLKLFYIEARKEDGTAYSKSTLNSFRFGLNRHYISTRDINIINDRNRNKYVRKITDELTKNRRENDDGLVRQHGGGRTLTWGKNEKNIERYKPFQNLYESLH